MSSGVWSPKPQRSAFLTLLAALYFVLTLPGRTLSRPLGYARAGPSSYRGAGASESVAQGLGGGGLCRVAQRQASVHTELLLHRAPFRNGANSKDVFALRSIFPKMQVSQTFRAALTKFHGPGSSGGWMSRIRALADVLPVRASFRLADTDFSLWPQMLGTGTASSS